MSIEWDGKGLPPVGCECEGLFTRFGLNRWEWQKCLVLWAFEHECAVKAIHTSTLHYCDEFRPIRTEAERKREEAAEAMNIAWRARAGEEDGGKLKSIYEIIYDAIAAGKIPGIRLTDDAGS